MLLLAPQARGCQPPPAWRSRNSGKYSPSAATRQFQEHRYDESASQTSCSKTWRQLDSKRQVQFDGGIIDMMMASVHVAKQDGTTRLPMPENRVDFVSSLQRISRQDAARWQRSVQVSLTGGV
jgi:hypothetical protein